MRRDSNTSLAPGQAENGVPLDAERAVLGAMLADPAAIDAARTMLAPADFARLAHSKVFEAVLAIHARGERADFIMTTEELRKRGDLDVVGGREILTDIAATTTGANLEGYARVVREHARNRGAMRFVLETRVAMEREPDRAAEILLAQRDRFAELEAGTGAARAMVEYLDLGSADGITPVPWIVPGWVAAEDIVLASGDGGIGKSTTIAALALAVATGGAWCGIQVMRSGRVLIFDEEQSAREVSRLYLRLGAPCDNLHVASQQGLNLSTLEGLRRVEHELAAHLPVLVVLDSVQQVFAGVDGNDAASVAEVYAALFRLRRDYGTAFILIGHLRKPPADGNIAKVHLVHGSVAFSTQASTVWVATQPARGLLDLIQVKRRDGDRTSLRIRYESEGPDSPITMTGEGTPEEQETVTERAQDFVVGYLRTHGTSPTRWIVEAAQHENPPIPERTVKRALSHLSDQLKSIERPRRGYYGLAQTHQEGD